MNLQTLGVSLGLLAMVTSPGLAQAPDGKALYATHCRKCHGVLGAPPKTIKQKMEKIATFDEAFAKDHSEEQIIRVLTAGGKTSDMKSFREKMTPAESRAVAQYVRELALKPRS
jgi:mono/diheme cytochrome c family protein